MGAREDDDGATRKRRNIVISDFVYGSEHLREKIVVEYFSPCFVALPDALGKSGGR